MVQANKLWSQQNFGFKHIICLWQLSEKIIEIGEINDTKVKQLLKDINCNPPPPPAWFGNNSMIIRFSESK